MIPKIWVLGGLLSAILSLTVTADGKLADADDKRPVVSEGPRLPLTPPLPQPLPQPVSTLKWDERYVIPSDKKCDFIFFPEGIVELGEKKGPRDWTAKFAGGPGVEEDRTYESPILYHLRARKTGKVRATIIPTGYKDRTEWSVVDLDVNADGGVLPPVPTPPNPPVPTPAPVPAVGKQFVVVLADRFNLDPARASALGSSKVRDYLKSVSFEMEVLDPTTEDGKKRADPFLKIVSGRGTPPPVVILMDAEGTTKGLVRGTFALPTTDTDFLDKIKTVTGAK